MAPYPSELEGFIPPFRPSCFQNELTPLLRETTWQGDATPSQKSVRLLWEKFHRPQHRSIIVRCSRLKSTMNGWHFVIRYFLSTSIVSTFIPPFCVICPVIKSPQC